MVASFKEIDQKKKAKISALNALLDLLPFELDLPVYKNLGPRTKPAERIEPGDEAINALDQVALDDDKA